MSALLSETTAAHTTRPNRYLLVKYSLFNVYLSTLTLTTFPHRGSNGRLATAHGIVLKRGQKKLMTQRGA